MIRYLILALFQAQQPETPSLFDKPAFSESKFEARVDAGAHASAGMGQAGAIPPISLLRLGAPQPSRSNDAGARADHDAALRLERDGKIVEAAEAYARAIAKDATLQHLLDGGVFMVKHGAYRTATQWLERARALDRGDAEAGLALGLAYLAQRRFEESGRTVAAVSDPRALGVVELLVDSAPQVGQLLETRVADSPYLQAKILARGSGDAGRVAALLRKAIAAGDHTAKAHMELARWFQDRQQMDEAVREYNAALALDSTLELAHLRLGQLHQKAGKSTLAAEHFAAYRKLHETRLAKDEAERKARVILAEKP